MLCERRLARSCPAQGFPSGFQKLQISKSYVAGNQVLEEWFQSWHGKEAEGRSASNDFSCLEHKRQEKVNQLSKRVLA